MEANQISSRNTVIAFVVIVLAIIIGGMLVYFSRPQPTEITINPPIPTSTPSPTNTPEPITVYVTGEVSQPQTTVIVPHDSRVSDVIEMAGGFTENANLDLVNLAAIVRDGDQVHVPTLNDNANTLEALPTPSGGELVYINTATSEELQTLPGIGETTAQAIIDYREQNGAFASPEDLDEVDGIGPSTIEDLLPLISFE